MIEISQSVSAAAIADKLREVPKLVIGIVASGQSERQLAQLARSIELASVPLAESSVQLNILQVGFSCSMGKLPVVAVGGDYRADSISATNDLLRCGFAAAAAQWFLRLHPDCVLHRASLGHLVATSRAQPGTLLEARRFPDEDPKFYCPQTGETSWAGGDCLLVPREVFERIGGFDANLRGHLADVDYSWRARQAGFTTRVCPGALYGSPGDRTAESTHGDRASLLSARYLAWKWNDPDAQQAAELALIEQGHLADLAALPQLPATKPHQCAGGRTVGDCSDFRLFRANRWTSAQTAESTHAGQVQA